MNELRTTSLEDYLISNNWTKSVAFWYSIHNFGLQEVEPNKNNVHNQKTFWYPDTCFIDFEI